MHLKTCCDLRKIVCFYNEIEEGMIESMLKCINFLLLLVGIICGVVGVVCSIKKKERIEKIINILLTILGLMVSLLSAEGIYYINVLETYNFAIQQNEATIGLISKQESLMSENSINSNNQITNNQITNNTVFENSNTDEKTLLNYAQFYYLANNYEGVARVYGLSTLSNNPIALTNLGYMYANGVYFQQNIEMAENYYNKAIELGCQQAMANKVAMYLKFKLSGTEMVIADACENKNVNVGIFLAETMDRLTNYSYMYISDFSQMYNYYGSLSDAERVELIEDMYYWEDAGLVTYAEKPEESKIETYEFIRFSDRDYAVYGIYRKYALKCFLLDALDECFIII